VSGIGIKCSKNAATQVERENYLYEVKALVHKCLRLFFKAKKEKRALWCCSRKT
jgi:hypothetical protein